MLVERVRSEVLAVAEGQGGLVRGLEEFRGGLRELRSGQEELRRVIASLGTRLGFVEHAVTDGFGQVHKEIGNLRVIVTEIREQATLLNARLDAHEERGHVGM